MKTEMKDAYHRFPISDVTERIVLAKMERITFNTVEAEKELEQMEDVLKTLRTFSTVVGASKGISSVIQTVL